MKFKLQLLSIIFIIIISLVGCKKNDNSTLTSSTDRIGIIGAMDVEIESLKESANIKEKTVIAGMEFCTGNLENKDVVIVKCGMGKVNAAICTNTLINIFKCNKIINTGVAGSLDSRINIGDLVVSTDAVQHDFNVDYLGFQKGEIPYTGLYAFEADKEMRSIALEAIKNQAPEINVFEGRVCSGDQFIYTKEQRDTITNNFGGLCCEMEGAAIAQTCYLNNVPFVIIRAISDNPDETVYVDYKVFEAEAAHRCANIIIYFLRSL